MIKKYVKKLGPLASYGIAYTASSALHKGIGFFVFMFLANLLTIPQYAKFGLSYSIFTIVSTLAYSGIYEAIIGLLRDHKNKGKINDLFRGANTVFLLLASISFIIVFLSIFFFYKDNYDSISEILIIIASAGLSAYFVYQSIVIRLEEKHVVSILFSFVPAMLGYVGGFVGVKIFHTGSSYFLGALIGFLISCLLILPFSKNIVLGFTLKTENIKLILARISPYIVIALLAWLLGYGNTFLIKYLFSDFDVAVFVFLFTISSLIQLVASSMNQVWSPRFYKNFETDSIAVLEKKYNKFTFLQGLLLGSVGAIILIIAPFILENFAQLKRFSNTKTEIFLLFAGYIVSIPWWHVQNYYMICNKGRALMNLTIISGIIGYVTWFVLMLTIGEIGIYLGFFIQLFIRSCIVFVSAKKHWEVKFDIRGVMCGLIVLLIGYLLAKN